MNPVVKHVRGTNGNALARAIESAVEQVGFEPTAVTTNLEQSNTSTMYHAWLFWWNLPDDIVPVAGRPGRRAPRRAR